MNHSTQSPAGNDVSPEIISTILNDQLRSNIIAILSEQRSTTTLENLADEVLVREGRKESNRRKDRLKLLTELHHIHLPKLASVGLLHYDSDQQIIQYRENERVESWLETVRKEMG